MIIGTVASYFGKFHDIFHMKVVGNVPAGYCIQFGSVKTFILKRSKISFALEEKDSTFPLRMFSLLPNYQFYIYMISVSL